MILGRPLPEEEAMQQVGRKIDEPVAVVGFAFQFPQGAVDEESLWQKLINKECTSTDFPEYKLNIEAFHNPDTKSQGTIRPKKAHFLRDDVRNFDAQFFGTPPAEAACLDPQQRGLLETTYHALENAGIRRGDIAGSDASVHVGSFCNDHMTFVMRDEQQIPTYNATGASQTLLSNRISWAFDLRGTSLTIDTACSSGLVALDLACREIWTGRSSTAVCAASNVIFSPENLITLSNMNFLSPDGKCFSFDHRGNGYAKGEGFACLILKPLSKALEDGNTIRALIRSTGSNQDGHTAGGITQPSKAAQKRLIAETYEAAGLDLGETRLFEAHGTGTAIGDPIEAAAIGETFRRFRSANDPLFVGAAKSNFGHLEGASGLLGVIKTILSIERGVIPPNTNFEKLNEDIDDAFFNIKFPTEEAAWPKTGSGVRRASVNSFGYGGTNAHVVIDDAQSYMNRWGLTGNHEVRSVPVTYSHPVHQESSHGKEPPRLLVFSAFDEQGIQRQLIKHSETLKILPRDCLDDYAYTLACRRDAQAWRAFSILVSAADAQDKPLLPSSKPYRSSHVNPTTCFVFTGQGAQWHGMAQQLLDCSVFRYSLVKSQRLLERLGWTSSLIRLLGESSFARLLDRAQYSQVSTTCVQIALVDVFRWLRVSPSVVVGHSSGEIAAAYCAGYLDHFSALKASYYRGLLSSSLEDDAGESHSMTAVGLSVDDVRAHIADFAATQVGELLGEFTISCINSPRSVTISGPLKALRKFTEYLTANGVFARLLKVKVGYHSAQMSRIASQYADLMGVLRADLSTIRKTVMVSSVTGAIIEPHEVCLPAYWVQNMASTVNFLAAIRSCSAKNTRKDMKRLDGSHAEQISVNVWVEIGPHSALKGPLNQIVHDHNAQAPFVYASALVRKVPALQSLLEAIGCLWSANVSIDMQRTTALSCDEGHVFRTLPFLPAYPFNHSVMYWEESRANLDFRMRKNACHDLVGNRIGDLRSKAEAQWRFRIRVKNMPWVQDHKIQGSVVYPAAGSIAMVIEAAKQLMEGGRKLVSLGLKDVEFPAPIHLSNDHDTQIVLHLSAKRRGQSSDNHYRFRAFCSTSDASHETLVCSGFVRGDFSIPSSQFEQGDKTMEYLRAALLETKNEWADTIDNQNLYADMSKIGLEYGPSFQTLADIKCGVQGRALARSLPLPSEVSRTMASNFTVHPTRLDGLFQLGFVAMAGGTTSMQSMVPTRIGKLHIPIAGFGHEHESGEIAHCQATQVTERNASFSLTVFDESATTLKAHVEDLELTALSSKSEVRKGIEDAPAVCFQIQWKPDLSTMSTKQVISYCQSRESASVGSEWVDALHSLTLSYATLALQSIRNREETSGTSVMASSMKGYMSWLSEQIDDGALVDPRNLGDLIDSLPCNSLIDAYVTIGRSLPDILTGDIDLLTLLPQEMDTTQLLQELGTKISTSSRDSLTAYMDCLTHKHPDLSFCEIGAGFGTVAQSFFGSFADGTTARRYATYTIVDDNEASLERMRRQMTAKQEFDFKTINGTKEVITQGFTPQSYDVIIINSTSSDGAVPHSAEFIESVVTLLKPDGKLIVRNAPTQNLLWGFLYGLMNVSAQSQMHVPDYSALFPTPIPLGRPMASDKIPGWSSTVYHNQGVHKIVASSECPIIIVNQDSTLQQAIGTQFCEITGAGSAANIMSLSDATALSELSHSDFIILLESQKPFLSTVKQADFAAVRDILMTAKSVVWVKKANDIPDYAVSEGLIRVSRHENERTPVVSLGLEIEGRDPSAIANSIHSVLSEMRRGWSVSRNAYETEYRECNGVLCIPRIIEAREHDKHVFLNMEKLLVRQPIGDKRLSMAIGAVGVLDTLEFVHNESEEAPLKDDYVEIEVRAIGVNFKDLMGLLGRASGKDLGSEFAGVVTEVGASVENVKPGDRVVAAYVDAYRTHARKPWQVVYRIPDDVSFEAVASIPTVFRTAYFCLYNLAHLQKGELILIHRASGGTGQAAIQLAQMIGATIYVTVGSQAKKELLIERYGIPEEHILHSRNASFGSAIKRLTKGRGVDVVINSLSGELLEASWDCVAPFGRFIEIGLGDAYTRQQLPMFNFTSGISFMSFNLANFMLPEFFPLHIPLMKSVWDLLVEKKIRPPFPLHVFPVERAEEAFRLLNSGDSSGKIVIEMDKKSTVPIVAPRLSAHRLDPNATYVVTGGLGGLGLKIAQWLCSKGAMNLILVSRSGLSKNLDAQKLVSELASNGVHIECPALDIVDQDAMTTYFTKYQQTMPPIKGCIQSAMVLRDATLLNMTIDDWHQALAPKVRGTWNLHNLLPPMNFFILLSSIVGVGGNRGQASYAAGNTFEDEFARWRTTTQHCKTVSLDLGFFVDAGVMAENDALVRSFERRKVARANRLNEIFALFDHICDRNIPIEAEEHSQIITGMKLPSETIQEGADVPSEYELPMFRIAHHIQAAGDSTSPFPNGATRKSFRALFTAAGSKEDAVAVTSVALQAKLAQILGVQVEEVEANKPLSQYGMDSLVAVELQNWIQREVEADVGIFKVLGEATVETLSKTIVASSKLGDKT